MDFTQGHNKGDPVLKCLTQGPERPHCLQNCALMGSETKKKLMVGGSPVVQVWHQVKALRTKRASTWMSSAR